MSIRERRSLLIISLESISYNIPKVVFYGGYAQKSAAQLLRAVVL